RFIERLLDPSQENAFLAEFVPFQQKVAWFGQFNSLCQVLLKLTSPGVPDFYQGTELWDFSLVDPDNRRPVDFELRRNVLAELKQQFDTESTGRKKFLQSLLRDDQIGRSKLFVVWRTLQLLGRNPGLFSEGSYVPLRVTGSKANHVCAFARVVKDHAALIIIPRLPATLTGGEMRVPTGPKVWKDTMVWMPESLRPKKYQNIFSG